MTADERGGKEGERLAVLFDGVMNDLSGDATSRLPLLDFGCGAGDLVSALLARGYNAHGCDIVPAWQGAPDAPATRLREIARSPYRLPFADATFGVVLSSSVLEHVQNTEECFREISRVLVPGGWAIHLFPSKWYLPYEPHIFVPLVNFFWPRCPRWWLAVWIFLGVRNKYQREMTWRDTTAFNACYCRDNLCYRPKRAYRRIAREVFGNCEFPNHLYVRHAIGGFAKLFRKMPFPRLSGWISGTYRMGLLAMRKSPVSGDSPARRAPRPARRRAP